ncbi:MAG: Rrf2 family transcriptional regulator [Polyangiales bacterium]
MQLTRFTDYALRTLLYLGTHPDEVIPASAISDAFDISPDHLVKAAKWLTQRGYVRASRGAGGGLMLARAPSSIRIGALVRETEPHAGVLECFEPEVDTCKLSASCMLKRALAEATRAFFDVLDGYTLADLLSNRDQLVQLLPRVGRRA